MIPDRRSTSTRAASTSRLILRRAAVAQVLEPQAQRGERRAQLVRGVGGEVALRGDQALEPAGHGVEGAGEVLDLARPGRLADARRQLAAARAATADRRSRCSGPVMVRASTTPIAPTAAIPTR